MRRRTARADLTNEDGRASVSADHGSFHHSGLPDPDQAAALAIPAITPMESPPGGHFGSRHASDRDLGRLACGRCGPRRRTIRFTDPRRVAGERGLRGRARAPFLPGGAIPCQRRSVARNHVFRDRRTSDPRARAGSSAWPRPRRADPLRLGHPQGTARRLTRPAHPRPRPPSRSGRSLSPRSTSRRPSFEQTIAPFAWCRHRLHHRRTRRAVGACICAGAGARERGRGRGPRR